MPWFTKQRKKKARNTLLWFWGDNFGFSSQIQGRFQPVSAISDMFRPYQSPADRPDMADMARFWPNQLSLAQIEADSAWIEPHRRESSRVGANLRKKKKKKNADAVRHVGNRVGRRVPRRTTSDAGAAPLVPRPCFLGYHWQNDYKNWILYFFILTTNNRLLDYPSS